MAIYVPADSSLVDTNLLLRGSQLMHPMFVLADASVATLRMRGEIVYACPQNLTEFWAVATRPLIANGLGLTTASAEAELTRIEALFPLLPDDPAIYPAWRRLVVGAGVAGKTTHDARLLAVAQVYGINRLLTFNVRDFTRYAALVPDVQIVHSSTV